MYTKKRTDLRARLVSICLLSTALLGPLEITNVARAAGLTVFIAEEPPLATRIGKGFVNNASGAIKAYQPIFTVPDKVDYSKNLLVSKKAASADLIVVRGTLQFDHLIKEGILRDLTDRRLALIDAGITYKLSQQGMVVGAELPWDPSYVVTVGRNTKQIKEAFGFMTHLRPNVLQLKVDNKLMKVKSHKLTNHTNEIVYGLHLDYDRDAEDADLDNRDWECRVIGNKVVCKTAIGLSEGATVAVGVAFRSDEPGVLEECWWAKNNQSKAGSC